MIIRRIRRKKIPGESISNAGSGRPDGPALWAELHRAALSAPSRPGFSAYLATFRLRLPCGDCRAHWDAWVKANQPGDDVFAWTVDAHNAVNARIGKPHVHLPDARRLWTVDTPPK